MSGHVKTSQGPQNTLDPRGFRSPGLIVGQCHGLVVVAKSSNSNGLLREHHRYRQDNKQEQAHKTHLNMTNNRQRLNELRELNTDTNEH